MSKYGPPASSEAQSGGIYTAGGMVYYFNASEPRGFSPMPGSAPGSVFLIGSLSKAGR